MDTVQSRKSKIIRHLLAISIAVLPIHLYMIWYRLNQTEGFSVSDMLIYPLVFGGGSVLLILLLNRYLLRSSFKATFNEGVGRLGMDTLIGFGLTAIYFAMFFLDRITIYRWIPRNGPPNTEILDVLAQLANDPVMMLVWFGPVLWIGIALFEELSRVLLLKSLWTISSNKNWEIAVILLTSTLIGFAHIYQGMAGVISIGLKSIVMCVFFYKYRRIFPLIVSHVLYDGIQFAFVMVQFQQ